MTLRIEMTPELEQQLQQAADKAGVTPDAYIVRLLQQNLKPTHRLPDNEVELLQRIDRSLSHIEWPRYSNLLSKRNAQTLNPTEHNELIAISEQIELANAQRIEALGELSRIRNTSINDLIAELQPPRKPRQPGSAIGTLTIVTEDETHLEDFHDYMP